MDESAGGLLQRFEAGELDGGAGVADFKDAFLALSQSSVGLARSSSGIIGNRSESAAQGSLQSGCSGGGPAAFLETLEEFDARGLSQPVGEDVGSGVGDVLSRNEVAQQLAFRLRNEGEALVRGLVNHGKLAFGTVTETTPSLHGTWNERRLTVFEGERVSCDVVLLPGPDNGFGGSRAAPMQRVTDSSVAAVAGEVSGTAFVLSGGVEGGGWKTSEFSFQEGRLLDEGGAQHDGRVCEANVFHLTPGAMSASLQKDSLLSLRVAGAKSALLVELHSAPASLLRDQEQTTIYHGEGLYTIREKDPGPQQHRVTSQQELEDSILLPMVDAIALERKPMLLLGDMFRDAFLFRLFAFDRAVGANQDQMMLADQAGEMKGMAQSLAQMIAAGVHIPDEWGVLDKVVDDDQVVLYRFMLFTEDASSVVAGKFDKLKHINLRLHLFPDAAETYIHNHRGNFFSTQLAGTYTHWVWKVSDDGDNANSTHRSWLRTLEEGKDGVSKVTLTAQAEKIGKVERAVEFSHYVGHTYYLKNEAFHTVVLPSDSTGDDRYTLSLMCKDRVEGVPTLVLQSDEEGLRDPEGIQKSQNVILEGDEKAKCLERIESMILVGLASQSPESVLKDKIDAAELVKKIKHCTSGRKFWTEKFGNPTGTVRASVSTQGLVDELTSSKEFLRPKSPGAEDNLGRLITLVFEDICVSENSVSADEFDKFLAWFGPFDQDLLTRFTDIVGEPGFFGKISAQDAGSRCGMGEYLLRLSSTSPGEFTLTTNTSIAGTTHQRLSYHYTADTGKWTNYFDVFKKEFPRIQEFIEAKTVRKTGSLRAASGSRYDSLDDQMYLSAGSSESSASKRSGDGVDRNPSNLKRSRG